MTFCPQLCMGIAPRRYTEIGLLRNMIFFIFAFNSKLRQYATDPTSVQEHMLKLFDNCASLKFGRGNKTVTGMTSSEAGAHTHSLQSST